MTVRARHRKSAPDRIRTCDLMLRRHALYPTELRARRRPRSPMGAPGQGSGAARKGAAPAAGRRRARRVSARNKPSSVPSRGRIIHLGLPSPAASCGLPGTRTGRAAPRPLRGLAPGGVCRAASVASGPVRSYRTVSPLPVPPGGPSAVCSLLHFPSPRGARALPGTLPCGARTFLPWSASRHGRSSLARSRLATPAGRPGSARRPQPPRTRAYLRTARPLPPALATPST